MTWLLHVVLIQVLGHSLIMWDSVKATTDWVQEHIPKVSYITSTYIILYNRLFSRRKFFVNWPISTFQEWKFSQIIKST